MRKICFGLFFIATVMNIAAQNISQKVISTAGGYVKTNNTQLSYTIGETAIHLLNSPKGNIAEGFQQSNVLDAKPEIDIASLEAQTDNLSSKLTFKTNTSFKTDYLILERLNNQTGEYESITNQKYLANNDNLIQYYFADRFPQEGDNLYRIKQVMLQGKPQYSEIKTLNFGKKSSVISVFPNPSSDYLFIDLASQAGNNATINIFSESGIIVFQQKLDIIGKVPYKISLSDMKTGNYQIQIKTEGGDSYFKKIMVTK